MKAVFCFVIFLLLEAGMAFRRDGRIVNGEPADVSNFLYQAEVRYKNLKAIFCGATFIDRHVVMTAGHCTMER